MRGSMRKRWFEIRCIPHPVQIRNEQLMLFIIVTFFMIRLLKPRSRRSKGACFVVLLIIRSDSAFLLLRLDVRKSGVERGDVRAAQLAVQVVFRDPDHHPR